ncbi:hypothetical protein L6R52_29685, partial [Myxococcota bacterium]|nr:hypothetical protein [Myxococcota bacterium]
MKKAAERWPGFTVRPAKAGEPGWQLTLELDALAERPALADARTSTTSTVAAPPTVLPGVVDRIAAVHLRLVAV